MEIIGLLAALAVALLVGQFLLLAGVFLTTDSRRAMDFFNGLLAVAGLEMALTLWSFLALRPHSTEDQLILVAPLGLSALFVITAVYRAKRPRARGASQRASREQEK